MTRFNAIRQYHFRRLIAERDSHICKNGQGPMVLTWTQARYLWKAANWLAGGNAGILANLTF